MAEFLEDFDPVDINRRVDQGDFKASQFERFKHDYRENGEPACSGDDDGDHSSCAQAAKNVHQGKKELVNTTRKLRKAMASLNLMKASDTVFQMLEELKKINFQLQEIIIKINSEFTQTTVPLPDYDDVDMKSFLGENEVEDRKPILQLVQAQIDTNKKDLDIVLFRAEVILREYDHMRHGIPTSSQK